MEWAEGSFRLKSVVLTVVLIFTGTLACHAQDKPAAACNFPYDGFATSSHQQPQIAEFTIGTALNLELCGSSSGCAASRTAIATPVWILRKQGAWTCGYYSGRSGAGTTWIRSDALRAVSYDAHPPLKAWIGTWTGGEDRVVIRSAGAPGMLHLAGNAVWRGRENDVHFGDMKGDASPAGNHLHFVEHGPDSCTIDLTLLNRYILASDNQLCGALNARFQGVWKRIGP